MLVILKIKAIKLECLFFSRLFQSRLESVTVNDKTPSNEDSVADLSSSTVSFLGSGASFSLSPTVAAQTSEVFAWGSGKTTPCKVDEFSELGNSAISVSVGANHMAAVSIERELFTWNVRTHNLFHMFKSLRLRSLFSLVESVLTAMLANWVLARR